MAQDDLLPKKKAASKPASSSKGASPPMLRLMRITRTIGVLLGGFVALVGMMGVVGFLTESFWVRLLVALIVVIALPAFVSDRFLKRTNMGGGLRMVADIFAILLLGTALVLVGVEIVSRPLFVREGDRYARSGSRAMARVVYFLGGVSPVFPEEKKTPPPAPSGSASSGAPGK